MSTLNELQEQRNAIIEKLHNIDLSYGGIDNEENAKKVQELTLEKAEATEQKRELKEILDSLEKRLTEIDKEVEQCSTKGIDKLLDAISKQRWYFFKNKPALVFDRDSGRVWNNPDYIPFFTNANENYYADNKLIDYISKLEIDGADIWYMPCFSVLQFILNKDSNYPFYSALKGHNILCFNSSDEIKRCYLGTSGSLESCSDYSGALVIYSTIFIRDSSYLSDAAPTNMAFTQKEKSKMTLDLFVKNDLMPIFDDDSITQLYNSMFIERTQLTKQLTELQAQLNELEPQINSSADSVNPADFDCVKMLENYDLDGITASVIKYYKAVQKWIGELIDILAEYENEKRSFIDGFSAINEQFAGEYTANPALDDNENKLVCDRRELFKKEFSLDLKSVRTKLLSFKKQADDIECRIDKISSEDEPITALAALEDEKRASFPFIAENTAQIVQKAIGKLEAFEMKYPYINYIAETVDTWTQAYIAFKTSGRKNLSDSCQNDGIDESVWSIWYLDCQSIHFAAESMLESILERGLNSSFNTNAADTQIPAQLVAALETFKGEINKFYLEERTGIYQKFAFQQFGALQDIFESESEIAKIANKFDDTVKSIIFKCTDSQDRIYIFDWESSLLNLQLDAVLNAVAEKAEQKISDSLCSELAELKKRDSGVYLSSESTYSEEQTKAVKQFNSLIFKMRSELMK